MKHFEVSFEGPDKKGFGLATVDLLKTMGDLAGMPVTATPKMKPDTRLDETTWVSDEGYTFRLGDGGVVVVEGPGEWSAWAASMADAEIAAGAHFFGVDAGPA